MLLVPVLVLALASAAPDEEAQGYSGPIIGAEVGASFAVLPGPFPGAHLRPFVAWSFERLALQVDATIEVTPILLGAYAAGLVLFSPIAERSFRIDVGGGPVIGGITTLGDDPGTASGGGGVVVARATWWFEHLGIGLGARAPVMYISSDVFLCEPALTASVALRL